MLIEVLFIDGNLTVSECEEAETNKSCLYLVNTSTEQEAGLFSTIVSMARPVTNWRVSRTAVSGPFALKR